MLLIFRTANKFISGYCHVKCSPRVTRNNPPSKSSKIQSEGIIMHKLRSTWSKWAECSAARVTWLRNISLDIAWFFFTRSNWECGTWDFGNFAKAYRATRFLLQSYDEIGFRTLRTESELGFLKDYNFRYCIVLHYRIFWIP